MTIQTRHDVGDKAWRMYQNKPLEDQIREIYIRVIGSGPGLSFVEEGYILNFGGGGFKAGQFYPTKAELLESFK